MRSRFLRSTPTLVAAGVVALTAVALPAVAHGSRPDTHANGFSRFIAPNEQHQTLGVGTRFLRRAFNPGGGMAPVVLTNGLNNPRQLSLVDNSVLLIAEAGRGGSACSGSGQDTTCIGSTGAVSSLLFPQGGSSRAHTTLVNNLISGAGPDGSFAVGSDGVSQRSIWSPIYIQETFAPPDVIPSGLPGEQSGKLLAAHAFGNPNTVADITAYEQAHDPDGHGVDSDPYAVVARKHDQLVADAAADDILRVDDHGHVSVFHVFPNVVNSVTTAVTGTWPGYDPTPAFPGAEFVPAALAIGPNNDVYVGGLVSEFPGQGQVVELDGNTGNVVRTWTGFSTVTGVAVGDDGSLYVSQLAAPEANPPTPDVTGVLTKVTADGVHHDVDVPFPAGVAVDYWNNVFVSAFSIAPATGLAGTPAGVDSSGQVWRLRF